MGKNGAGMVLIMKSHIAFKRIGFKLFWALPYQVKREFYLLWLRTQYPTDVSGGGERWPVTWEEIFGIECYIHSLHGARYCVIAPEMVKQRVLDLACGCGYGSYFLSHFAESVVGLDNDPKAIKWASDHFKRPNLKFVVGDALNLNLRIHVDVVVCIEIIEHFTQRQQERFLSQVCSLNPNTVYLTIPNADINSFRVVELRQAKRFNKDEFHCGELTFSEFSSLLNQYFSDCKLLGFGLEKTNTYQDWLKLRFGAISVDDFKIRSFDRSCENILAICRGANVA